MRWYYYSHATLLRDNNVTKMIAMLEVVFSSCKQGINKECRNAVHFAAHRLDLGWGPGVAC